MGKFHSQKDLEISRQKDNLVSNHMKGPETIQINLEHSCAVTETKRELSDVKLEATKCDGNGDCDSRGDVRLLRLVNLSLVVHFLSWEHSTIIKM